MPQAEPVVPKIPIDYSWAQRAWSHPKTGCLHLHHLGRPWARGSSCTPGMPISDVFREDIGIGGVMSAAVVPPPPAQTTPPSSSRWSSCSPPTTAPPCLVPMNTIITTRAGKDLISALVSRSPYTSARDSVVPSTAPLRSLPRPSTRA